MFMFSFFLEEYIKCQIIRPDRYKIAVLSIHGTLLFYSAIYMYMFESNMDVEIKSDT